MRWLFLGIELSSSTSQRSVIRVHTLCVNLAVNVVHQFCARLARSRGAIRPFVSMKSWFEVLRRAVVALQDAAATRERLHGDAAAGCELIKRQVLLAENARVLERWEESQVTYHQPYATSLDVFRAHERRIDERKTFLKHLKVINYAVASASKIWYVSMCVRCCRCGTHDVYSSVHSVNFCS